MFMQHKNPRTSELRAPNGAPLGMTPPAVTERFGNPKARPKVVQVYNPRIGWSALAKRVPLTDELMSQLLTSGATMVDARWRSHRHRIALLDVSQTQAAH